MNFYRNFLLMDVSIQLVPPFKMGGTPPPGSSLVTPLIACLKSSTFKKRQRLQFTGFFVMIARRSFALSMPPDVRLVIWIDFIHKFGRHLSISDLNAGQKYRNYDD